MTKSDLQQLSIVRLREARSLFSSGEYSGAYYLTGYVVECGLKACIASRTVQFEFPEKKRVQDSHTHNLLALVGVAGLAVPLTLRKSDPVFAAYWQTVVEWSEASRYALFERADADALLTAVTDVKDGVLAWVQQHW